MNATPKVITVAKTPAIDNHCIIGLETLYSRISDSILILIIDSHVVLQ